MRLSLVFALLFATPALADGFGFVTPSRNIYCNGGVTGGGFIDCAIVERSGPPALPRPASCGESWGHYFSIDGTGTARLSCGRAPQRTNYSDVADYGLTGQFGDITCQSERTGLTCTNASGHGFFLSRRQQRVF